MRPVHVSYMRNSESSEMREGDVVEGRVVAIEDYGVWIEYEGARGLLKIVDLAQEPPADPAAVGAVGDTIRVRVTGLHDQGFNASQKALYPEVDYSSVRAHSEGDIVTGTTTRALRYGYVLRLDSGVEAVLPEHPGELEMGARYSLRVENVDPELEVLEVSFVGRLHG